MTWVSTNNWNSFEDNNMWKILNFTFCWKHNRHFVISRDPPLPTDPHLTLWEKESLESADAFTVVQIQITVANCWLWRVLWNIFHCGNSLKFYIKSPAVCKMYTWSQKIGAIFMPIFNVEKRYTNFGRNGGKIWEIVEIGIDMYIYS